MKIREREYRACSECGARPKPPSLVLCATCFAQLDAKMTLLLTPPASGKEGKGE